MKKTLAFVLFGIATMLALLSFGIKTNTTKDNIKTMKDSYETLWKEFDKHLENSLPESAEKVLNSIEKAALEENNQVQLLKTILHRHRVMRMTVEDDPTATWLAYAESKSGTLDAVENAILNEEIGRVYHDYLNDNDYRINNNLAIDGPLDSVEMKYWDRKTFERLIDEHFEKALKPVEALKRARTEDYLCLYQHLSNPAMIQYEPTMFEFLFHRIAKQYQEDADADDLQPGWNTEQWWLQDKDFVKVDFGSDDSPLLRCLRFYQELIAFNLGSDKETALYNDYKRYQFVQDILDEPALYQTAIRRLMKQYHNSAQYPDLCNLLAQNLIQQYESNENDSSYFDNYREAAELCKQVIADHPKSSEGCKNTLEYLKHSNFHLNINQVQLPNEPIPAILEYRNLPEWNYKLIKVDEKEFENMQRLYDKELFAALRKKKPVKEEKVVLPAETDYRKHSTVVALPALERGIYYFVSGETTLCFFVSDLAVITNKGDRRLDLLTVSRKTGLPEAGVTVQASRRRWDYHERKYVTDILATVTSDQEGRAHFDSKLENQSFEITLRKNGDVLLPNNNFYMPGAPGSPRVYDQTKLFTDRAIYRPGQTVYFKGIVVHWEGNKQTLATHCPEELVFRDANSQEISRASFTTDEWGAFNGSFVIPTNLLNGVFHIRGNHGDISFRVEEYKRPTYEIHFESVKEQYKLKQEVTVRGSVDAYAGFGLDNVEYSYRIVRKTQFPWRCWWWWYPAVEDEQIDYGTGRTDETGKFAITFNLKPSLKTKPEQQPVFTYEIEVIATSAQGETHSDTHYLRAGYNEIAVTTSLNGLMEQAELAEQRIEVFNMNGSPAKSRVSRKVYRFDEDPAIDYFSCFDITRLTTDRQALSDKEMADLFPNYSFHDNAYRMKHKTLVFADELTVDDEAPLLPKGRTLLPGKYYVELKSLDDPLAQTAKEFKVYQKDSKKMPYKAMWWSDVENSTAKPGDVVRYHIGSSARNVRVWLQLTHGDEVRMEQMVTLNDEVKEFTYTVTEDDRGGLVFKTAFVKENDFEIDYNSIDVPYDNYQLDVSLATLRDKLSPGAEETWTVKVKDYQGNGVHSALLAGMYDASLDVFASHYWSFSMSPSWVSSSNFGGNQHRFITTESPSFYFGYAVLFNFNLPSDYPFFDFFYGRRYFRKGGQYEIEEDRILMCEAAGSVPMPQAMTMKDASSINNSEADVEEEAGNDEGTLESPEKKEEQTVSVRENFNETAFFFPNLKTDADGSSTFTFTLPDALTRWNLMMLAYTKDNKTGSYTHSFTASKPVMIMADMPRYLYDTDTLWFVANVINTGDEPVTPKARLEIFDAATMQPVNLLLTDADLPLKEIVPGRSQEVRWKVAAQYDLSLLAFRFTAFAGEFSDAEQHLMPVLSSEIFMTQTLPITVHGETEKTFDFESIANPESHERDYSLTLNFSTNPVWYAVQSLPYLANVRTDRPESAFYVFYANSLSAYIAANVPNLMNYIKKWQIETPDALMSQLEKDEDLKAILLQETPWVLEAKSESEQRSRIANLFELNNLKQQQTETLEFLKKTQKPNGGWPWFEGMPESPYITTYILSGFGKLERMNVWTAMSKADQNKASEICKDAVRFVEYSVAEYYREMRRYDHEWSIGSTMLDRLYALSFFKEQNSDRDFAEAKKYFLDRLSKKKDWTKFTFSDRALAAMLLYRTGDVKTAKLIIQSFKECAQKNEEIGMYWPKKYFIYMSHVATHAQIMSAFAEIDQNQEMLDDLRVWLLTQKRTNMWENSASTAEAIYALLMRGTDWFAEGKDVTLRFGATPVSTEGGEAGTGFIQRRWNAGEVTPEMRQLTVNNPTEHLVWGGLFRQYFVPIDEVKSNAAGMKIKREVFVETVTDNGKLLVPVAKRTLKVGDKLTVKLTLESEQDMSFVFVKDLRAAGFEPLEQISRYHYGDGMSYYQSTTDVDMEFFVEFLPKGVHQLEYSLYVTKEGNLSNGYALAQCLYAPEFSAYSDGMRVKVGE